MNTMMNDYQNETLSAEQEGAELHEQELDEEYQMQIAESMCRL